MLDIHTAIFVWIGSEANDTEKAAAESTAAAYIRVNRMDPATPIITVKSGAEPEIFQANFLGWNDARKPAFVVCRRREIQTDRGSEVETLEVQVTDAVEST